MTPRVVRVVTDVVAVDKQFDYLVPEGIDIGLGDRVRVDFHGRSVTAWVVALDPPDEGRDLKPIKKRMGFGPHPNMFDFAQRAATYYCTPFVRALEAASPTRNITVLPEAPRSVASVESAQYAPGLWKVGPCHDLLDVVLSAQAQCASRPGSLLVLVPTEGWAERLAERLNRRNIPSARAHDEWAKMRAGWPVVVGARNTVFAPVPEVAGVVVLDGDDASFVSEGSPSWNAVRLAKMRSDESGAPLWVTTTIVSPFLRELVPVLHEDDSSRDEWPRIDVIDRRLGDPRDGALSQEVIREAHRALRGNSDIAVTVILQRLGTARLLACRQCGELFRCATCRGPEIESDGLVACAERHDARESFCRHCGATKPRAIRSGVTTLARDVALQLSQPVAEVTATSGPPAVGLRVVVGTEAVFRHVRKCDLVVFVDFDQYLLGRKERSRRDAVLAVARAGRLVGAQGSSRGLVMIQTRRGDDDVVVALRQHSLGDIESAENALAQELALPPFSCVAEIGGVGGEAYAEALRAAGVEVWSDSSKYFVSAHTNEELRALLARASRPAGAMRLAID